MVATRSKLTQTVETGNVLLKSTVTKKTIKTSTKISKPQAPKSPSKSPRKQRIRFEDSLAHIEHAPGNVLPQAFIEYHSPHFIEAVMHILSVDPTLYRTIVSANFHRYKKGAAESIKEEHLANPLALVQSYWFSLMSSVIGQQVSGAAADAIKGRFVKLFEKEPNPKELLTKLHESLRAVGLSNQKVKYVMHISEVFNDPLQNLSLADFYKNSNPDTIIEELVKLKGIGVWSAKMFSMFTLREWDVFSHEDLGIARGAAYYLEKRPEVFKEIQEEVKSDEQLKQLLKKKGLFSKADSKRDWVPLHDQYLIHLSKKFLPYRTVFSLLLWRISSTNITVLDE